MNINNLIKNKWYIQGINAVPMFIEAGPISGIKFCREILGYGYDRFIMDFQDDYLDLYYHVPSMERIWKIFYKKYKEDKKYLKWLWKKSKELENPIQNYKIKDPSSVEELKQFYYLFCKNFGASHLIEAVSMILEHKVGKEAINFAPTKKLFITEYHEDLLRLSKLKSKDFDNYLKKHLKKYYWIKTQWNIGREYTKEDVIDELKTIKKEKNIKRNDKKYKKENKEFIDILDFFAYWQDQRKIIMLKGIYIMEHFVKEISKKLIIKPEFLKYALVDELPNVTKEELEQRKKGSIYFYDMDEIKIISGKEYKEIHKQLQKKEKTGQEINGTIASIGKAIGKVKIVLRDTDTKKINDGDILVTTMTRPELVPAMKKAAAIVTDEGGITSHAAVISRELGLPCIIGTKIATQILKDNQLIEVNANHGWVKIIK